MYYVLRLIGRVSFPLFAFSVGIGLKYTRDLTKYITRLFLFALITMVPYSLFVTLSHTTQVKQLTFITFENTNIMFSFLGSAICVYIYENFKNKGVLFEIMSWVVIILIGLLSVLFNTDYDVFGVLLPFFIYRAKNKWQYIFVTFIFMLYLYNDRNMTYFLLNVIFLFILFFAEDKLETQESKLVFIL